MSEEKESGVNQHATHSIAFLASTENTQFLVVIFWDFIVVTTCNHEAWISSVDELKERFTNRTTIKGFISWYWHFEFHTEANK